MNILVISDLHIDACDSFGTFQWDECNFILQIEKVRERYDIDKVILNGDIYELLKYTYSEISAANGILMRYLIRNDFIYIRGNHDIVNRFGIESYDIINSSGQTIHIEHGHNADWFNGTRIGRTIGRFGFSILKSLSRSKSLMNIYFRIVAIEDQINHIPKRYNTLKYLTYALKLLKGYDVVILAHTHKLESHHTYYLNKKKRYLNCGTCSLGRFQGIILDTESLKYEMIMETKESVINTYKLDMVV